MTEEIRRDEMTEEITFKTVLKNERKKTGAVIWDWRGNSLGILPPRCQRTLESWNRETLYAPYSEVVWKEDGTVETKANPEYSQAKSRWTLTVLNRGGGEIERRIIAHREVVLPRGLARTFELSPEDPLAVYSKMEILRILERGTQVNLTFSEYSTFKAVLKDKYFDRPAEELKELEDELKRLAEIDNA